jgi:hypothetical protein
MSSETRLYRKCIICCILMPTKYINSFWHKSNLFRTWMQYRGKATVYKNIRSGVTCTRVAQSLPNCGQLSNIHNKSNYKFASQKTLPETKTEITEVFIYISVCVFFSYVKGRTLTQLLKPLRILLRIRRVIFNLPAINYTGFSSTLG